MTEEFIDLGTFVAIINLLVTTVGAILVVSQLYQNKKTYKLSQSISKVQFLFEIYTRFEQYNELHENLMEGISIDVKEDWVKISSVLAIFEYVYELKQEKIVNIDEIDYFYGYRLATLYAHPAINTRYFAQRTVNSWQNLNDLIEEIKNKPIFKQHLTIAKNNQKITPNNDQRKK
jgi:hypothetical protein